MILASSPLATVPLATAGQRPRRISYRMRVEALMRVHRQECRYIKSPLSRFLLHYFSCEAAARLLRGVKSGLPPSRALSSKKPVHVEAVKAAARQFKLGVREQTIEAIFKAGSATSQTISARQFRDAIAHQMSERHIVKVKQRAPQLTKDMQSFLMAIEKWGSSLNK